MSDEQSIESIDIGALKSELESGKLSVASIIQFIDGKLMSLDERVKEAKALVEKASKTGHDCLGLGNSKRFQVVAEVLPQITDAVSQSNEIMRGVIALTVCSAHFTNELIEYSSNLLQGKLTDTDGRIIQISEQTRTLMQTVILPIAAGIKATEAHMQTQIHTALQEMHELVFQESEKNSAAFIEQKKILTAHGADIENTRAQISHISATDAAQDQELKRQAKKDIEHDQKLADNARGINANAKAISSLQGVLKRHRHAIANVKVGSGGVGKAALVCSLIALVLSVGVALFVLLCL